MLVRLTAPLVTTRSRLTKRTGALAAPPESQETEFVPAGAGFTRDSTVIVVTAGHARFGRLDGRESEERTARTSAGRSETSVPS